MSSALIGYEELVAKLRRIADSPYDDDANQAFLAAAQVIAAAARRNAPARSGRLRRAIVAGTWRRSSDAKRRYGPGAWAQVNLLRRYVRTAPHGHLVEAGRKAVRPRRPWRDGPSGRWVAPKAVRGFAGRYFFRRAVEENQSVALDRAAAKLQEIADKAAK